MLNMSLIITTYNRPKALANVLKAVAQQQHLPAEVLIADDGSRQETRDLIQHFAKHYPCQLKHVWQPDHGFQAASARNRAAAQSCGEYLLFIDGDCLPLIDFCQQHFLLSERAYFVTGQRILLNAEITKKIERGDENPVDWNKQQWLWMRWKKQVNRLSPLQKIPGHWWRKGFYKKRWQGAKTCNLATWRDDFLAVNGFDELYQGWGHEDADLVIRLLHHGIARKTGHCAIPVLHLWHPEVDRSNESNNLTLLQRRMQKSTLILAERGVDQYL